MFLGRSCLKHLLALPVLGSIGTLACPLQDQLVCPYQGRTVVLADPRLWQDRLACRSVGRTLPGNGLPVLVSKVLWPCRLGTFPVSRIDRSSGLWVVKFAGIGLPCSSSFLPGHRIELSCSLDRLLGLRVDWELGCLVDWVASPVAGSIGLPV